MIIITVDIAGDVVVAVVVVVVDVLWNDGGTTADMKLVLVAARFWFHINTQIDLRLKSFHVER